MCFMLVVYERSCFRASRHAVGDGDGAVAGKILIVDDEQSIRDMIGFALSHAGYSYVEAADVAQAETEVLQEFPDLILSS